MAQSAPHQDTDPQRYPRLSPDEQRIANAVVAALQSELQPIKDTLQQHTVTLQQHTETLQQHTETLQQLTETLAQHSKILAVIQQEMRGVNKILAAEGFIPDNPDI